jgi:hypothetical protein
LEEPKSGSEPQRIELPVGISGRISAPGEQDSYRFKAEQDQELTLEVLAFRTGSPLDSSLVIRSASGKDLARSEDAKGFDSFLHFRVPETGEYVVLLRDFRYGGSHAHKYHLMVGALPYIDSVYPCGAQRGQSVDVTLKGINLAGLEQIRLLPDASAPLGWQDIRVRTANGLSSPFPFNVGEIGEFLESEPNDASNQANVVTVPVIINGRIGAPKDVDQFKFKLDKAQTLICEVTAQRFGSPLDALLTLRDAAGKILQQNDDSEGADARIEFAFQKDQEYTLAIRDLLARGGADYVYRLSIRPPEPDFAVRFSPDNPRINCNGRTILHCDVVRRNGFASPLRIAGDDLPAGITAEPLLLTPGEPASGLIVLTAAANAAPGAHALKLRATATLDGKVLVHDGEPMSATMPTREALLTVLDTPPLFTIDLLTLSLLLEQDQSANLEVAVARKEGFEGDIKLTAEGYSSGREPLTDNVDVQPITAKPGEHRVSLKMKAKLDSEIGSRLIYVKAESTNGGQTITQYSQAIPLTITQIPFTLFNTMKRLSVAVLPAGTTSAAGEAEFVVKASRRGWFTDQVNLSLEGVPEGVLATSTNLPSHVGEVTFKLTTTDKAPAQKEFQIRVLGSATIGGRTYQQKTAPMTLSITAPPQEVAAAK